MCRGLTDMSTVSRIRQAVLSASFVGARIELGFTSLSGLPAILSRMLNAS